MNSRKGSDVYTETSVSLLAHPSLGVYNTVADQCAHGAQINGEPIRKATELWSNKDIASLSPSLTSRCAGDHKHLHLRGSSAQGTLTLQAAHFPSGLCDSILEFVERAAQAVPNGGESC